MIHERGRGGGKERERMEGQWMEGPRRWWLSGKGARVRHEGANVVGSAVAPRRCMKQLSLARVRARERSPSEEEEEEEDDDDDDDDDDDYLRIQVSSRL